MTISMMQCTHEFKVLGFYCAFYESQIIMLAEVNCCGYCGDLMVRYKGGF